MAKRNETENQNLTWGTWEELLLACAVHRYGTKSWDSVAMEMQKRSSNLNLLTAQTCKQKFHDLKRRFMDQNDVVSDHDDGDADKTIHPIPWLDELRKLRVAELKREVERYDLSIVSLQLKVKRLKEERERSLGENEKEREKSDQEKSVEKDKEEENVVGDGEPAKSSPEYAAGKSDAGEESDRDNQSVNESNSTDRKGENLGTGQEEADGKPAQVKPDAAGEQDPAGECTKPAGEDSFNGSSDTIAKESAASPVENSDKAEPVRESGDSPELWESMAESKGGGGGGEEGMKENSDVQSSVKSQPENEDQSPAIKHSSVKSQPLVDFLEIIRSHRLGSIFERRLDSQETEKYTSLIRQHIDLETVRTRLEEGWYSECNRKFFRDLLLLFNNAMVFFGPKSSESMAAAELRQLVSKEITSRAPPKPDPSPQERNIPAPPALPIKPDTEPSDSLLAKQKISGPIIACRKRSSLAAKSSVPPPSSSASSERKKEQTATLMTEEKPVLNWKQQDNKVPKSSIDDAEEEEEQQQQQHRGTTKKRTRERFTPTTRNSTKNNKTRTNNKNSNANLNENSEPKLEKKNSSNSAGGGGSNAKKRGVANFLSRIKRCSTPNNGSLLETLKSSGISSENSRGGGGEQKRNGSRSETARKENQASSRKGGSSGKQQAKEQGSPAKRSVGRPPKRAAAPPPSLPPPVSGKRSREAAETEAVGSRQAKKRSRK